MKVLVTGAAGNVGQVVCRMLAASGEEVRMADVKPPTKENMGSGIFVRCDVRTPDDAQHAVQGMDAVIHLAAWHYAHVPPVSDASIFATNVDGTFHLLQACREHGVQAIVYASTMAIGWGSVFSVSKVIGEELCRMHQETTGAAVAILRYHDHLPKSYLAYGARLFRSGVDRRDVATATVAAVRAAVEKRFRLFRTIVHTHHGLPEWVQNDFKKYGLDWCKKRVPEAEDLIKKYDISLPDVIEQHDLSDAKKTLGWQPAIGFIQFLEDLKERDARGENVHALWTPSDLSVVRAEGRA